MSEYGLTKKEFEYMVETTFKVSFDRLRELATADAEGRVVIRPFKKGQIVFAISDGQVYECIVDYCGNDCVVISHKKYYSSYADEFVPYVCAAISSDGNEVQVFEAEPEAARALSEASAAGTSCNGEQDGI